MVYVYYKTFHPVAPIKKRLNIYVEKIGCGSKLKSADESEMLRSKPRHVQPFTPSSY